MKVFIGPREEMYHTNSIEIHNYDTWNLEVTIARIIHPALVRYKEVSQYYGHIDDEDTPLPYQNGDDYEQAKWNYFLDTIIATFALICQKEMNLGNDLPFVQEGLRLFGKYYLHLWN